MPGITPVYGFPFQGIGDPPDGPNLGQLLAMAVEQALQQANATIAALAATVPHAPVYARLISNANQTINNNTFIAGQVNFTSAVVDSAIGWNIANPSRYIIPVKGVWQLNGHVKWAASAAGTQRTLLWNVNGSQVAGSSSVQPPNANGFMQSCSPTLVPLNIGDIVEIQTYQDSGGTLNIGNNAYAPEYSAMDVVLIAATP